MKNTNGIIFHNETFQKKSYDKRQVCAICKTHVQKAITKRLKVKEMYRGMGGLQFCLLKTALALLALFPYKF